MTFTRSSETLLNMPEHVYFIIIIIIIIIIIKKDRFILPYA